MRTYVIAEIGSCHDGDFDKAAKLVKAAQDAGADAVKAQYWSNPLKLGERRRVPEKYVDLYRRYEVPHSWLGALRQIARKGSGQAAGIDFMCTAYLPEDVATIAPYVDHFKIASFEAEAYDLLDAHLPFLRFNSSLGPGYHRWIIVSLGMGASDPRPQWEDEDLTLWFEHRRLLHCVSAYPAPVASLNLANLSWASGFSDHSEPALTWTGALAAAAGARIIEAHIKLDETDPQNPDAPHAMSPWEFTNYVRHIRFAESCLGEPTFTAHPAEAEMAQYKVRS